MFEYMTRHMVAKRPMTYAGQDLQPGDPFVATPDDEGYFVRTNRAESIAEPVPVAAVAPPPFVQSQPPAPPPAQPDPAPAAEAGAASEAKTSDAEPEAQAAAEDTAAAPRRRGRQPGKASATTSEQAPE